jgi:hypothetical protein
MERITGRQVSYSALLKRKKKKDVGIQNRVGTCGTSIMHKLKNKCTQHSYQNLKERGIFRDL